MLLAVIWVIVLSYSAVLFWRYRWRWFSIGLGIYCFICPPFAVWVKKGCCSGDLIIGIALTFMGWLPGVIYAWHIIATTGTRPRGPRDLKGADVYAIREIKQEIRDDDGRPMYSVSWMGYGSDQDTWEYAGNISREAMIAYRKRTPRRESLARTTSRQRNNIRRTSSIRAGSEGKRGQSFTPTSVPVTTPLADEGARARKSTNASKNGIDGVWNR